MHEDNDFMALYSVLLNEFGHRSWWPAETPFEVTIGAILTQNTNWANVEAAIANLKAAHCLSAQRIVAIDLKELQKLVRPAGYFRQKAKRLKILSEWIYEKCDDDVNLDNLKGMTLDFIREELLSLKGIGPETADSILLYALHKPVFVVDAYTARILGRHGLIFPDSGYDDIQVEITAHLPEDVDLFSDYHAQFVELGKRFCKKSRPRCEKCPVAVVLGQPDFDSFHLHNST